MLDTTGSMGGLIAAAKEKIWSIASTLAQAKQAPEISMGLVAYRDRGDAYVTQVVDLDKDLDSMYAKLMQFRADGGGDSPESVNQALDDAINQDLVEPGREHVSRRVPGRRRAAAHGLSGRREVPDDVAAAAAKGIVVNTIQCGNMRETVKPWQEIAALGHGRYFTVDQAGSAVAVATPFDDKIATLSAALDSTRLYYGSDEEKARMAGKLEASDDAARICVARGTGTARRVQRERGRRVEPARRQGSRRGRRERPRRVRRGARGRAAEVDRRSPRDKQEAAVAETAKKRQDLQRQIAELAKDRDAFIRKEIEAHGGAAGSLDQKIYDAVREQAAPVGLEYDGGPKF